MCQKKFAIFFGFVPYLCSPHLPALNWNLLYGNGLQWTAMDWPFMAILELSLHNWACSWVHSLWFWLLSIIIYYNLFKNKGSLPNSARILIKYGYLVIHVCTWLILGLNQPTQFGSWKRLQMRHTTGTTHSRLSNDSLGVNNV